MVFPRREMEVAHSLLAVVDHDPFEDLEEEEEGELIIIIIIVEYY